MEPPEGIEPSPQKSSLIVVDTVDVEGVSLGQEFELDREPRASAIWATRPRVAGAGFEPALSAGIFPSELESQPESVP